MTGFRLSVPGSLLVMGEYAVTLPGEPGIGAAAPARATASFTPDGGDELQVIFRYAESTETRAWKPGGSSADRSATARSDANPFAGDPIAAVTEAAGQLDLAHPGGTLVVDTTAFYRAGRKLGLGSSAAAVLLLCAAARILSGRLARGDAFGDAQLQQTASEAVRAHRVFQGGRGSGYDVLVSAFGGWISLTGGEAPAAQALEPARGFPAWALYSGPSAVRTVSAIDAFRSFSARSPESYLQYLEANRRICGQFAAGTGSERLTAIAAAAELGRQLGSAIGVSAETGTPPGPGVWKALGAGNELVAWFGTGDASPPRGSLIEWTQAEPVRGLEVIWP